ncbi:MAG: N-6 DNA methylase [Deltaproteobacteria bacterium]
MDISIIKKQIKELGFPLVEEPEIRNGPDLVCYQVGAEGQLKAVVVVELKAQFSRNTSSNLLTWAVQYRAEYAARTDGSFILWYQCVRDKMGDYLLVRASSAPAQAWDGRPAYDYPEDKISELLLWFRDQVQHNPGVYDIQGAWSGCLILLRAKLHAESIKVNSFRVLPRDDWNTFAQRILEAEVAGGVNQTRLNFRESNHDQALLRVGEYGPALPEIYLEFSRRIQALALHIYQQVLVEKLVEMTYGLVGRQRGLQPSPSWLSEFMAEFLLLRLRPRLVVELGSGLGTLMWKPALQWPEAQVIAVDNDFWLVQICSLLADLLGLTNFQGFNADVLAESRNWPEEFQSALLKTEVDLVLSHPPIGNPTVVAYEANFELSRRRRYRLEELFLERAVEITRPDGMIVMILPDTVLSSHSARLVREFMLRECWLEAVISLPQGIFTGTLALKASLVLLRKKGYEPRPQAVFMANLSEIRGELQPEALEEIIQAYGEWLETEGLRHGI